MAKSFFEIAYENSFPREIPWRPYKWPTLVREVVVTDLVRTPGGGGATGVRVPMAVRRVSNTKLVTSYRFVKANAVKPSSTHNPALAKPGAPATAASSGRRSFDPYGDFAFHVEIEGIGAGAFTKLDGLDLEIDQIEYKDSMDPHPHKRPGIYRFGNLKLTKGVIANTALWDWCKAMRRGELARKNGTIHVLADNHDQGEPVMSYNFVGAWPCKWTGLRLDGKGTATLIEEIELVIDYIERSG